MLYTWWLTTAKTEIKKHIRDQRLKEVHARFESWRIRLFGSIVPESSRTIDIEHCRWFYSTHGFTLAKRIVLIAVPISHYDGSWYLDMDYADTKTTINLTFLIIIKVNLWIFSAIEKPEVLYYWFSIQMMDRSKEHPRSRNTICCKITGHISTLLKSLEMACKSPLLSEIMYT